MTKLANYEITEKLHDSSNSLAYRAKRKTDQHPVILKVLRDIHPSPEQIARFKREYEVIKGLDIPGVIKIHGLEYYQQHWTMFLEDFGGESLARLNIFGQLTIPDFLQLALKITDSIGKIHQQYLIHKDINPANIVVVPPLGLKLINGRKIDFPQATSEWQVKIIDFGISTKLSRETVTFRNPHILEGTLSYISPEQTGRMNRPIDYRTDFYSLGVTFYELIAGELPFVGDDPLEMVHYHIAQAPRPLTITNPQIPSILSDIILKLMAKNAETRYQSAHGLWVDLSTCLKQWQEQGMLTPFPLAAYDVADRFDISPKLYGRENELNTLLTAFDRVSQGQSELMLVSGYSGVGKSVLVQELYKPITEQHGYFIVGKFDQFQRNVPYSALIQAFRSLMQQILTESDVQVSRWRQELLTALGANGQVIIEVMPEVELIIGPQPAVPTLDPTEAQNRFNWIMQQFISVFAHKTHPLAIFVDDLQWVDSASLKLLELLLTESHYLLLIGSYRNNEVDSMHPLMVTLNRLRTTSGVINEIALLPFSLPQVTLFVAETLRHSLDYVTPLAELLIAKTGGNPFFMNEFLKSLYQSRLVVFNYSSNKWEWNLTEIQARGITDNVVEFMADKIKSLPIATQDILQWAAIIGNRFKLDTLVVVTQQTPAEVAELLWVAMAEGLILPLSEAYNFMALEVEGLLERLTAEYKFAHDRIQQAVSTLISPDKQKELHWQVGQLLLKQTKQNDDDYLFVIVNHLNMGINLEQVDSVIREQLVELNSKASQKARLSMAYDAALLYTKSALNLLSSDSWENNYDITFKLFAQQAEIEYLLGNLTIAEELFQLVLTKAQNRTEKADIYRLRLILESTKGNHQQAIEEGLAALALFDIHLPTEGDALQQALGLELRAFKMELAKYPQIMDLMQLHTLTNPEQTFIMELILALTTPCYFANQSLFGLVAVKVANMSLIHGNSAIAAFGYAVVGMIFSTRLNDFDSSYEFGELALNLIAKFNNLRLKCKIHLFVGCFTNPWRGSLKKSQELLDEGYRVALEAGDLIYAVFCTGVDVRQMPSRPFILTELYDKATKYYEFANKLHFKDQIYNQILPQRFVLALEGKTISPTSLDDNQFSEAQMVADLHQYKFYVFVQWYYMQKAQLCYIFEEYTEALKYANQAEAIKAGFTVTYVEHKLYHGLILAALYPTVDENTQPQFWQTLLEIRDLFQKCAAHSPENFQHKYTIITAEVARLEGKFQIALEQYHQAAQLAQHQQNYRDEALAQELLGGFCLTHGLSQFAEVALRNAYYAYQQWGANSKLAQFERKYPQFIVTYSYEAGTTIIPTTGKHGTDTISGTHIHSNLDLRSVLKASQTLASEIIIDRLLANFMKLIIQSAGAEKGFLILPKNNQWFIEAEGHISLDALKVLQSIPLSEEGDYKVSTILSLSIVNYVIHTHQKVVLSNATRSQQFMRDSYVLQQQPKSILCWPLLNQGKLTGVVYLENNLTTDAFTHDRLEVLYLLSAQAAISIENARLLSERQQTIQKLEELDRAKSQFLTVMSHELRTPLNAILGFSELLLYGIYGDLPELAMRDIQLMFNSGQHLLTLINDVLDLSKIEAGMIELVQETVDAAHLVSEVIAAMTVVSQHKSLTIVADVPENLPYIYADRTRLKQILLNMVDNAIKFTPQGLVTIRLAIDPEDAQRLLFSVIDTGIGIEPDKQLLIFEAFSQADMSETRHHEGVGLGLAICKRLTEMHGSKIQLRSQVGVGSEFSFSIPISTELEL